MAVPHYVIDAPGGGGKIAIVPESIVEWNDSEIVLRNYEGKIYRYPNIQDDATVDEGYLPGSPALPFIDPE
jgi:L-lysine 2,3-aminomutase